MSSLRLRKGSSGQAIVIMALGSIVLLAAVMLGVDGARYFEQRRRLQNTVDAGVNAVLMAIAQGKNPQAAFDASLAQNLPGATGTLSIIPVTDPRLPGAMIVKGWVGHVMQAAFGGNVGVDKLYGSATAEGRYIPRRIYFGDGSLVATALKSECNTSLSISGGAFNIASGISNGDFNTSSAHGILGSVSSVGEYKPSQQVVTGSYEQLPAPLPLYGLPELINYAPGGASAKQAMDAGMYTAVVGNLTVNFNNQNTPPLKGLIFIDGDFNVIGDARIDPAGATIVATGSINVSASEIRWKYYVDGLLMMSMQQSNCGNNAITFSGSLVDLDGSIVALRGGVRISASNTNLNGSIIAWLISLSGSETNITGKKGTDAISPATTELVL